MSPEDFSEDMTSFEKLFFFVSEFDRENFWLLAWNFYMVLKTEVQVTTGFFRGKECIKENITTWFFPKFERKTAPISVNFFWRSVKRQSMTAAELLEEKVKVEINFDSLCHKFLTWVSFLLSTSPGEPFEEEIVSINSFLPLFFEQETFQISREVFSARLPGRQSMWLETFSHEMCFLRELVVYIIIFKNRAEGFWIFV